MKHLHAVITLATTILVMTTGPLSTQAQDLKILNVEEDTENGIGVHPCGDRHEAMLQFVTYEPFALGFRSNYDPDLKVEVDSAAGKKTYSIVLVTQAPGVNYDGRRLTILAPGFRPHRMTLNLRDKQKFVYTVSDPYSALRSPYFILQEQGNTHFYNGQYQRAKDTYQMLRTCPEYEINRETIDERITLCDSMIQWNAEALQKLQFAQFADAADLYTKMYFYNSANEDLMKQIVACRKSYRDDCQNEYILAEHYMDINQVELAKASYQRIIDKRCTDHISEATAALNNIRKHELKQQLHARCLFLELGQNLPFGFTYAQCYDTERRSSGYISLHFNQSVIGLISGKNTVEGSFYGSWPDYTLPDRDYINRLGTYGSNSLEERWTYGKEYAGEIGHEHPNKLDYEAALSFGWTINIWRYFYTHIGVGYHGGGFNTFDFNEAPKHIADSRNGDIPQATPFNDWPNDLRRSCTRANWFNGADLEGGLIFKIWHMNLKATVQYTYWMPDNTYEKFLEDNNLRYYLGLGFNW